MAAADFAFLGMDVPTLVHKAVTLAVVFLVALVAQRVVMRVTRRALETANVPSASIFVNVCRAIIWSFALLMVLQPVFGIEPTGFVAALGVTSVAISLGLQDTMSNLVGGLSLMLSRVIKPGDVITIGGVTGTVTDVNWRSTVIEQRGGDVQVIPNSVISKTAFTKLYDFTAGECQLPVVIDPAADLAAVRVDIEIAARKALHTAYDEEYGVVLFIRELSNVGTLATISIHTTPEISFSAARTAVASALANRAWLVRPVVVGPEGTGDDEVATDEGDKDGRSS